MNKLVPFINTVKELKDACIRAAEANVQFAQVFAPRMKDLSLIVAIHDRYVEIAAESGFKADGTSNNKQFLFIVLYLYSPASLLGGRINKELRSSIATALGISASTALYKMRSTSVSWYETYPEFRNECNLALEKIDAYLSDL